MKLCSRCNKRPAVVFVTRVEGEKSFPEGFCLKCAKELNIGPINQMLEQMNISDENMEEINSELMEAMDGIIDDDGKIDAQALNDKMDDLIPGGAATFPFMKDLMGGVSDDGTEHIVAEEVGDGDDKEPSDKPKRRGKKSS